MRLIVNRVRLFQSTLPRGERQVLPVPRPPVKIYFNPRSHEGSDKGEFNALMNAYISIHAPTRGATVKVEMVTYFDEFQSTLPRGERRFVYCDAHDGHQFQSTLPRGERRDPECPLTSNTVFQSTLPRGERQRKPMSLWLHKYFNPRSHEGSDSNIVQKQT